MSLSVITPPSALPIDVGAVKRSLGADGADVCDEDVGRMIKAAVGQIDGPTGWLGRAICLQTLELRLDGFCDDVPLPYPPFVGSLVIKYDDAAGAEQTLADSNYRVIGGDRPRLVRKPAVTWPSVYSQEECVRIRWQSGYTDEAIPACVQEAVIVMVRAAHSLGLRNLFISSETTDGVGSTSYVVSDNAAKVMREAAENLLAGLRVYS